MKRVLVVDDSMFWRELVGNAAKEAGGEVFYASDGLEGYNMAFEVEPDLIFTDIEMPKMKGYTLCRLLKNEEAFRNVGIVIMTSLGETLTRFWATTAGADGFMQKGGNPDKLIKDVKSYMKKDFRFARLGISRRSQPKYEEVTYLLENIILRETIKNEVYALYNYLSDEEHIFWKLADLVYQIVPTDYVVIMALDPQEGRLFVSTKSEKVDAEKLREKLFSIFSRPVVPFEWKIIGDGVGGKEVPELLPFIFRDRTGREQGILATDKSLGKSDKELISDIVANLGDLFKLTMSFASAVKQARYDELTGLLNFRALMDKLTEYFSIARRSFNPLSVGMIDIDDFKRVNDTYGHLTGNEVLRELARLMKDSFREVDVVGRYGGEEFLVAMANTTLDSAAAALERFRKKVEEYDWSKIHRGLKITVSIGAASTVNSKRYRTVLELIEDADSALYKAKSAGKNRVEKAA